MNRLPDQIKATLSKLIADNEFVDGFAVGGSIAKNEVSGDDVDVDLLCTSRIEIGRQVQALSAISETPYVSFITTFRDKFSKILPAAPPLHIRIAVGRELADQWHRRDSTIYVFRNREVARIWKVLSPGVEIHYVESS